MVGGHEKPIDFRMAAAETKLVSVWLSALLIASTVAVCIASPLLAVIPAVAAGAALLLDNHLAKTFVHFLQTSAARVFALFLGLAIISAFFSVDRVHAIKMIFGCVAVALSFGMCLLFIRSRFGLMRYAHWAAIVAYFFISVFLILIMSGMLELPFVRSGRGHELWPFNRAAIFLSLLTPILILALNGVFRGRIVFICVVVVLSGIGTYAIFMSPSESAMLATLVVYCTFLGALILPKFTRFAVGAATMTLLLVAPLLVRPLAHWFIQSQWHEYKAGTILARIKIWAGVQPFIVQSPILGNGVEYTRFTLFNDFVTGVAYGDTHPHSFLFQLWVDMGLLGVIAFGAVLFVVLRSYRQLSRLENACYLSLTAGVLCVWAVSHGMWQNWWFGLVAIMYICFASFLRSGGIAQAR